MKRPLRYIFSSLLLFIVCCPGADAQAIKTNIPLIATGNPNIGIEWSVGKQLTVNGDVLWAPYLFKKKRYSEH